MKKLLLSFFFVGLAVVGVQAQSCTPGAAYPSANFADSTYGVWPDTLENFPPAYVGVAYSTDLNFKVPAQVTPELDPSGAAVGSDIDNFTVTDVTGLPPGMTYACNISSCQYDGGTLGCANVSGTCNTAGTYPVEIFVDAVILIEIIPGFPTPVTQSTSFTGYRIEVGNMGQIELTQAPYIVVPNPATDKVSVKGFAEGNFVDGIMITNMNGQVMFTSEVEGLSSVDVDLTSFDSGMYFVTIYNQKGSEVIKFIKE